MLPFASQNSVHRNFDGCVKATCWLFEAALNEAHLYCWFGYHHNSASTYVFYHRLSFFPVYLYCHIVYNSCCMCEFYC